MNAVEYLGQIKRLDALIDSKVVQVSELRELATSVNGMVGGDRVQTDRKGDKLESLVAKIVDLEHEISANIDTFVDLKRDIMKAVDSLNDANQIAILYKRYFEYKTWEEIANEMNFSRQWVVELHRRACLKLTLKI